MIKALLIKGSNNGLTYLSNDIASMKKAFESIDVTCVCTSGNKFSVLQSLSEIIDNLSSTDSLIIYYSGHGVLKNGGLVLKLDDKGSVKDNLPLRELIENTLQSELTKTLFILDCCYSSASCFEWKTYASDKYVLLLPSSKLEQVEESDDLKGSYFTHFLSKVLIDKPNQLFDQSCITLNSYFITVKQYIQDYSINNHLSIPDPDLIGSNSIISKYILAKNISNNKEHELSEKVLKYYDDYKKCIFECERKCFYNTIWCNTISRLDANLKKYLTPTIKQYISNPSNDTKEKIDVFLNKWFTDNQNNYLVLLGDMGVGKSMACLYVFDYICENFESYVPIFISLNDFASQKIEDDNFYNFLSKYLNSRFKIDEIKELCNQQRLVFILDGFDEISNSANLNSILTNYNLLRRFFRLNCKTVLTCRTHYFSEKEQINEVLAGSAEGTDFANQLLYEEYPFNVVELLEFNKDEIIELIRLLSPGQNFNEIWEQICHIYDLKDLAKRAILLKMILQTLPELKKKNSSVTSYTIYKEYTKKILRREINDRKTGLELSEKERFISYIAYLMYKNDELVINSTAFNQEIKTYFINSIYSKDELNSINYDCRVANFFSRDKNDNYQFMHKSFYEYYFAKWCVLQLSENNMDSWKIRWFPKEIAYFIKSILCDRKYSHLIILVIRFSLESQDDLILWNTLHILSLIDDNIINTYLLLEHKVLFLERAFDENRCVIIRQYCRIISRFISREKAEELIDRVINIARNNFEENKKNDETYLNYYGGQKAACQAFISHLSVTKPKYDAKLHLYLLEHLANKDYLERIINATNQWENRSEYEEFINMTISALE